MRQIVTGIAATLVLASCQAQSPHLGDGASLPQVEPRPSPFAVVQAGQVEALVPTRWSSAPVALSSPIGEGIMASPDLHGWGRMDGTVPGFEAAWVDVGRQGVPSDFYYLAAIGPALPRLLTISSCRASYHRVLVDHRPLDDGSIDSPGDYAARGGGTCGQGAGATRWAYFVAAPGFGPVRQLGIPNSGLYIVVTVVPDQPGAIRQLNRMLYGARFARTTVWQLITASRASAHLQ